MANRPFQLTRSRGAWQRAVMLFLTRQKFQLTRSRGAWLNEQPTADVQEAFQLTRSRGAWRQTYINRRRSLRFQLTRSRGAWRARSDLQICHLHFNSHAHVERDSARCWIISWQLISTHTLTWSVTLDPTNVEYTAQISTHTLTWSVTSKGIWQSNGEVHFNSHAHVERDAKEYLQNAYKIEFQLTRSRGAWHTFGGKICKSQQFQLTRSRGAWQKRAVKSW